MADSSHPLESSRYKQEREIVAWFYLGWFEGCSWRGMCGVGCGVCGMECRVALFGKITTVSPQLGLCPSAPLDRALSLAYCHIEAQ